MFLFLRQFLPSNTYAGYDRPEFHLYVHHNKISIYNKGSILKSTYSSIEILSKSLISIIYIILLTLLCGMRGPRTFHNFSMLMFYYVICLKCHTTNNFQCIPT